MERDFREVVQSWLDGNFDEETKAQIRVLQETDPVALEDAFYRNLEFGTGGLRGIMGVGTNRMNKYTVGMATQGLANYMKANLEGPLSVCISFDSRNNSPEFAQITANVLAANGIHVYIFDKLHPIALMSYSVRTKKANAGIMITASHNPKEYNGYKVFWSDGAQVKSPVDKEIVDEVAKITDPSMVKFEAGEGAAPIEVMSHEMDEAYLNSVMTLMLSPEAVAAHKDIKIVYTPIHGSGVEIVPEFLNKLGFENIYHVPEQDVVDGNFPTVMSPNPEEPSALAMAVAVAEKEGAVVAPTAGMHFSKHLLKWMEIKGIDRSFITLHAGLGNFRSVDVEDLSKHKVESEQISIPQTVVDAVHGAQQNNHRICAIGTEVMRALEHVVGTNGQIKAYEGWTNKFIYPPYDFTVANAFFVNFYMPLSSQLMMVAAFGGHDAVMKAYQTAVKTGYRFGDYGDAMLILND